MPRVSVSYDYFATLHLTSSINVVYLPNKRTKPLGSKKIFKVRKTELDLFKYRITQQQVAEKANVSRQTVYNTMNGYHYNEQVITAAEALIEEAKCQ